MCLLTTRSEEQEREGIEKAKTTEEDGSRDTEPRREDVTDVTAGFQKDKRNVVASGLLYISDGWFV